MSSLSIWHWLIVCSVLAFYIVPAWRIVSKAGYHGGLSLLGLVPMVNVIMLWIFAFSDWPSQRKQ